MGPKSPLSTPSSPRISNHAFVDEEAVTLRLRPLRWRDRVLPDALPWGGAAATIAAVAGGFLFFASPSEAARLQTQTTPMMVPMTKAAPALSQAHVEPEPGALEGEEEDVVIILEDDDTVEDEVVIFDDSLDAPEAAAMAAAHIEREEYATALQYALSAAESQPKNAAHQALLGKVYRLNGDRKASRRALRRARRLRR